MRTQLRAPFMGLIATGIVASGALLIETRLSVSQDVHFLLELLWLGVAFAALLGFALLPAINEHAMAPIQPILIDTNIPEVLDTDREWLQAHPDQDWAEER
ncbi:MAG: hypothetical protein IPK19_09100 [Chloroflexi bacterium]|nr:hypothetical protein [Chloroflexota bacterium]